MDELLTALAEIEAVINSRPLSYLSSEGVEEPLTPSHLLVGRRILNLPDHLSRSSSEIGFPRGRKEIITLVVTVKA